MILSHLFNEVPSLNVAQVKEFLQRRAPSDCTLLDVRLVEEYNRKHIPGALNIPLGELHQRLGEISREKPVVVYCSIGGRSRSAVGILMNAGFGPVYNMTGGMNVWNGARGYGEPQHVVTSFSETQTVTDFLLAAWSLEEGSRRFYSLFCDNRFDDDITHLFAKLTEIENSHQEMLEELMSLFSNIKPTGDFASVPLEEASEAIIEGGMRLSQAKKWAENRPVADILSFAMALEAQMYDVYMYFRKKMDLPLYVKTLNTIAAQEKEHLESFTRLLEKVVKGQ